MERIYREMWEETGDLSPENFKNEVKQKHFGKITIQTGENLVTKKQFFTLFSAVDLFNNAEQKHNLSVEISECLKVLFKKYDVKSDSKILVVGLGNDKITADSLGCKVVDKLIVTSHAYNEMGVRTKFGNLCAIKSGVSGVTGIESFDLISSAVRTVKPDLIIAVDTLSCGKSERLGCTVQLTDNGIEPGAGVNNAKKKLTVESLKTPIVAIGVPFVIYIKTILGEFGVKKPTDKLSDLIVTAKEIDFLIGDYSDVIADAVNFAVHAKKIS
ncbi:MAG: GPR endopeptidase [Clostridia bacterium]|nr:GPR endopeptidase [Clostridia bacterium]